MTKGNCLICLLKSMFLVWQGAGVHLGHLRSFWTIWYHLGQLWSFWTVSEHLRPFGGYLGPLENCPIWIIHNLKKKSIFKYSLSYFHFHYPLSTIQLSIIHYPLTIIHHIFFLNLYHVTYYIFVHPSPWKSHYKWYSLQRASKKGEGYMWSNCPTLLSGCFKCLKMWYFVVQVDITQQTGQCRAALCRQSCY